MTLEDCWCFKRNENMAERSKEEIALLKKLNVSNFREIKKNQIIELANSLQKMDPEVAKNVIQQIPQFTDLVKSASNNYKEEISEIVSSNQENATKAIETATIILNSIDKLLDKDEFTPDQKLDLVDKMIQVQKMINEKDTENKTFLSTIAAYVQKNWEWIAGGTFLLVASCLGTTIARKK